MDNLQRIWFDRINIRTSEYGKPISCSYAEDIACFITDNNCIVIYLGKPHLTEKAKRITEKEELRTVHYLQLYDRIFVSMDLVVEELKQNYDPPKNCVERRWGTVSCELF
ncbi:hypothetical protein NQ317_007132 [Molorchus minor]|uniref:Uncharacterized protein n=1 Tax=Molorchus minor TaxID=1323400 RepID=A0ABQ9K0Q0_9CUCU|nr:hypothetical protein NQ317_007132 [Molorchus minor]